MLLLTEWILGFNSLLSGERIGGSQAVDSLNPELVPVARSQVLHFEVGLLAGSLASGDPTSGGFVHLLDDVVVDGAASVVGRWVPGELASLGVHLGHLQRSHGRARLV